MPRARHGFRFSSRRARVLAATLSTACAVVMGVAGCEPSDVPEEPLETRAVSLADTTLVPVLPVARLESQPEHRLEVEVTYPQLNPSAAPELAPMLDAINADIASRIVSRIDSFLVWARSVAESYPDESVSGASRMEGAFYKPFANDRVFSAGQEISVYFLGAAHPNTTLVVYNYDLPTGKPIALGDLFLSGSAFADTLSVHARLLLEREAEKRDLGRDGLFPEGYAPLAENFAHFTLGPDSLTLHFPPYAVAPYAAGSFSVSIAYSELRSILMSTGPASTLRTN